MISNNINTDDLIEQEDAEELSEFFKMYADPTRLKILNALFQKEMSVTEIANLLDMTHSAISHQLAVLKRNRIIRARRDKRNVYYALDDAHIESIYHSAYEHIKE